MAAPFCTIVIASGTSQVTIKGQTEREAALAAEAVLSRLEGSWLRITIRVECGDPATGRRVAFYLGEVAADFEVIAEVDCQPDQVRAAEVEVGGMTGALTGSFSPFHRRLGSEFGLRVAVSTTWPHASRTEATAWLSSAVSVSGKPFSRLNACRRMSLALAQLAHSKPSSSQTRWALVF
ncbi:hypothetical protein [Methylobacterium segetis]|uniref:hypothetical protein n=1 Tax=Methylobacterium segetis TaxID=2488750 RepID=UPI001044ABD9|nr:hypothetical protein [Methylobacterium segetis]